LIVNTFTIPKVMLMTVSVSVSVMAISLTYHLGVSGRREWQLLP
jgi:hypothetical protein